MARDHDHVSRELRGDQAVRCALSQELGQAVPLHLRGSLPGPHGVTKVPGITGPKIPIAVHSTTHGGEAPWATQTAPQAGPSWRRGLETQTGVRQVDGRRECNQENEARRCPAAWRRRHYATRASRRPAPRRSASEELGDAFKGLARSAQLHRASAATASVVTTR